MYIVSVHDETGMKLTERQAYREADLSFINNEFKILYPGREVRTVEYVPRTKETAEEEIKLKQK